MAELVSRYPLPAVRAATTDPQWALVERVVSVLEADARVLAAWLVGSFATAEADPFSDIDVQCLVTDEAAAELEDGWRDVVERISPTVQVTPFPGAFGGT